MVESPEAAIRFAERERKLEAEVKLAEEWAYLEVCVRERLTDSRVTEETGHERQVVDRATLGDMLMRFVKGQDERRDKLAVGCMRVPMVRCQVENMAGTDAAAP